LLQPAAVRSWTGTAAERLAARAASERREASLPLVQARLSALPEAEEVLHGAVAPQDAAELHVELAARGVAARRALPAHAAVLREAAALRAAMVQPGVRLSAARDAVQPSEADLSAAAPSCPLVRFQRAQPVRGQSARIARVTASSSAA